MTSRSRTGPGSAPLTVMDSERAALNDERTSAYGVRRLATDLGSRELPGIEQREQAPALRKRGRRGGRDRDFHVDCDPASAPAGTVHDAHGFGVVLAQQGQVQTVHLEVAEGLQHLAGGHVGPHRVFLVGLRVPPLCLLAGQEFDQANGVFTIGRVRGHAGATDVDVGATILLVGKENAQLFRGRALGRVIAGEHGPQVVGVGDRDVADTCGGSADLVAVATLRWPRQVGHQALDPLARRF